MRERRTGDEEGTAQVDRLLEIPGLRLGVAARPCDPEAGGVDEHVHAPVELHMLGHEPGAVVLERHVSRNDRGVEALAGDLESLEPPPGEREGVPLLPQHPGDGETDPRRAAGDEG